MKKVLIGTFTTESNENIPEKNEITSYDIAFGNELITKMMVGDIFEAEGVEIIPSIYANSGAAGVTKKHTYDYIKSCFLNTIREHLNELDGIYLMLHGASYVDNGVGSGDHDIIRSIRDIVGPYLPITVSCDPHGNLTKEYVENCSCIRSYRQSPHTDATETKRKMVKLICDLVKNPRHIVPVYRKLPLILGGEQSVSTDEPVLSINKYMDEMEKDPRVLSASWHVGYLRHDCPEAGCGIVVVPQNPEDREYCEIKADELAKYVWDKRHEFHYTGYTAEPDKALEDVLNFNGKPCVITDSGDNTTSGAKGWNTFILRQVLKANPAKHFLFASINDPICEATLENLKVGEESDIKLGVGHDEWSAPVDLKVKVICKGEVENIKNIWADSTLLDLKKYKYRFYNGTGNQEPDSLMEAVNGIGKTPAYRDMCYIVFENFPLTEFNNRIPNFLFEITRKNDYTIDENSLDFCVKGINLMPCNGYSRLNTKIQYRAKDQINPDYIPSGVGSWTVLNQNNSENVADGLLSLNQLLDRFVNCEWVVPHIAIFANSLNIKDCELKPRVDFNVFTSYPNTIGYPIYTKPNSFRVGTKWNRYNTPLLGKNSDGTYTIRLSETSPLKNVSYFNSYDTQTKSTDVAIYNPTMVNPITNNVGA